MVEPDPWNVIEKNHQVTTQNCVAATDLPNAASNASHPSSSFEDNFLSNDSSAATEKLPDSNEYIQALGIYMQIFDYFWIFSVFNLPIILLQWSFEFVHVTNDETAIINRNKLKPVSHTERKKNVSNVK